MRCTNITPDPLPLELILVRSFPSLGFRIWDSVQHEMGKAPNERFNQVLKKRVLQILGDLHDRLAPSVQVDEYWLLGYFFYPDGLEICQQQIERYPDHTSCWCLSRNIDRSNIKVHENLHVFQILFLLSFLRIKLKEWAYTGVFRVASGQTKFE